MTASGTLAREHRRHAARAAADALALEYAFIPTPYPVRASASGADPNTIDLQVTISPPSSAVTLREVIVTIPVGSDTEPGDLSAAADLPQPANLSGADGWTVSASGSSVTLLGPSQGLAIAGPISFTLPGIAVNEVSGTVVISATEFPPTEPKVIADAGTLFKEQSDYPVVSFTATPSAVYNLDQTVTLNWTCTDQGKTECLYSLSGGSWQPRDCLNGGQCFTWQDGEAGVVTPPLQQTTVYELDVVRSGNGGRYVASTLTVTVPILTPSVLQDSYAEQNPVAGGRFVSLHWVALNAAYCSVLVDNVVVAQQAPADSYDDGFLVYVGEPGTHQVSIQAFAVQGDARASFIFGEFTVNAGWQTALLDPPSSIAATIDGRVVLPLRDANTLSNRSVLQPIDPAVQQLPPPIGLYMSPGEVFCSPTGAYGGVLAGSKRAIVWWDLAGGDGGETVLWDTAPLCAASFPDGQSVLVGCDNGVVGQLYVGQQSPDPGFRPGGTPLCVATAPPGTAATLGLAGTSSPAVTVIDLATFAVQGDPVPLPADPAAIAVTPDGSLALAALPSTGQLAVIDVAAQSLESNTIAVGGQPVSVSITPDGSIAFVADAANALAVAVDVARRTVLGSFVVAPQPVGLAVTSDGKYLAVACSDSVAQLF